MNPFDPPPRLCCYRTCENEGRWVVRFWRWRDGQRTDVGVLRTICEEHRHPLHEVEHEFHQRAERRQAHRVGDRWNEDVEVVGILAPPELIEPGLRAAPPLRAKTPVERMMDDGGPGAGGFEW